MVLRGAPLAAKRETREAYECNRRRIKSRNIRCADEARKFILGPMPVRAFLDSFLPDVSLDAMPPSGHAFECVSSSAKTELQDIYKLLVTCLNGHGGKRCPGYEFKTTAPPSSPASESRIRPGNVQQYICLYNKAIDEGPYTLNGDAIAPLGYSELFIDATHIDCFSYPPITQDELMDRSSYQSTVDTPSEDESTWKQSQQDLGRMVSYTIETLARQHRIFYFSISIIGGTKARLIRWDRAGAIATEAFDIHTRPEWLCEFIWRYTHGTEEDRGFDGTVASANQEDEALFKEVVRQHVELQTGFVGKQLEEAIAEHYEPNKVAVAHVLEQGSFTADGVHAYLISRPVTSPLTMSGCATRGYWAVCRATHRIVFLKDTWRHDVDGKNLEGDTLQMLWDRKVSNIPELVHHGDVPMKMPGFMESLHGEASIGYQDTISEEVLSADWVCGRNATPVRLRSRRHYRLVLGTVGYPLERLEGTHELLHATFHAYQAMVDALNNAKTLHRDISVGNILLVRNSPKEARRGYLIDWELSCPVDQNGDACRRNEHAGTWAFMSSRIFGLGKDFVHHIIDDMESMMYVVLYCGLRWLPHDLPDERLHAILTILFDGGTDSSGRLVGGDSKASNRLCRQYTRQVTFDCPAFDRWLTTVMNYNYPMRTDLAKFGGKWNGPEHLYTFWNDFLLTANMPEDDRVSRSCYRDQLPSTTRSNTGSSDASSITSMCISSAYCSTPSSKDIGGAAKSGRPTTTSTSVDTSSVFENQRSISNELISKRTQMAC